MRKNWGKLFILLLTTAAISSTMTIPATAKAASRQLEAFDTRADENKTAEDTDADENDTEDTAAEDTENENTDNENVSEDTSDSEKTDTGKKKDKTKKTAKKDTNYKETTLTITKTGFVADSFNGVDAIYRPGGNDGSSATYSCAAFIKKYYKKVYGVSVYSLFGGSTPKTYEGKKIVSVKTPKAGDITYKNGHWSIVKKVNSDNTVTLIEQNWKWGGNQCKANRTVGTSTLKYFRLAK